MTLRSTDERCPLCNGLGKFLGRLGPLVHLRCQDCGADFHAHYDDVDLTDDDNGIEPTIGYTDYEPDEDGPCPLCHRHTHTPECPEYGPPISQRSYNLQ
jgi:rubrerythrin